MWTDLNLWRAIVTVLAFVCFLGIIAWAWLGGRNNGFDDAASLPFEAEDEPEQHPESPNPKGKQHE